MPTAHSENAYRIGMGFKAGADLAAVMNCFVRIDSSGEIVAATSGQVPNGVLYNDPDTDQAATFDIFGVVRIKYGGSVAVGDILVPGSGGKAVAASSGIGYAKALVAGSDGHIGYALLFPQAVPLGGNGVETVTSGALSDSKAYSNLSVTGTQAYTLPDGLYAGQEKTIECSVAASSPAGTLTITTPIAGQSATHFFNTVGQRLKLYWTGSAWKVIEKRRVGSETVVVGTDVLTGHDMAGTYNLSITGTVSSTTTRAIPDGTIEGEVIWVRCTTAASTPNGSIGITAKTLAGAAATALAVNATTDYEQLPWDGSAWQEQITNSATLS